MGDVGIWSNEELAAEMALWSHHGDTSRLSASRAHLAFKEYERRISRSNIIEKDYDFFLHQLSLPSAGSQP